MNTVIIDDEQLILDNLKFVLGQFEEFSVCYESTNPFETLDYIRNTENIDIIFADISMPMLSGIEFAERVFNLNPDIHIVFVTAYEKYAIDAFNVNAVGYILKPVTVSGIQKILNKLEKLNEKTEKSNSQNTETEGEYNLSKIVGMKNSQYVMFDESEIYFIMALDRELVMYTKNDEYRIKYNISFWEEKLRNKGWIRCHRSYLINTKYISRISPMFNSTYVVHLKNRQEEIPVSRTYIGKFKKALNL